MGNIGPAFGEFGPTDNYAMMPKLGKWVLAFCMLLGRLEIFTVMVLLVKHLEIRITYVCKKRLIDNVGILTIDNQSSLNALNLKF